MENERAIAVCRIVALLLSALVAWYLFPFYFQLLTGIPREEQS